MDLRRRLARLSAKSPASPAETPAEITPPPEETAALREPTPPEPPPTNARLEELRKRIEALTEKTKSKAPRKKKPKIELPFDRTHTEHGALHLRLKQYAHSHRHGNVSPAKALLATGEATATFSLDETLAKFDPSTALFLDVETTGLSGGTGTLAFLVGLAFFQEQTLHVEQLFLADPSDEAALLTHLHQRVSSATSLVTFNGKSFDLPLLRTRFVMTRIAPPKEPPHLDLLHAARRVYGERLGQCTLAMVEREVLGFLREDDVPSAEIPALYAQFLRRGDVAGVLPVIEHNLHDVVTMAALLGELAARTARSGEAEGAFSPKDHASLARTALRAGRQQLALALANELLETRDQSVDPQAAARAGQVAAQAHAKQNDPKSMRDALLQSLKKAPKDPTLHLALAKLFEHKFRDPVRALKHAKLARDAETPEALQKRLLRLSARPELRQLSLPGMD